MREKKFIGRLNELAALKKLYHKRTASIVTIQGRRRIGKSRLVEEFAKGSRFLSFAGLAPNDFISAQNQKDEFTRRMSEQLSIPKVVSNDWGDLFSFLAKHTEHGRVVILLDEISWMAYKDKTFLSKLKNAWDLHFSKNPKLILVLCGSVSAWIDKNILSNTGFIGRISLSLTLNELSLSESIELLNQFGFKKSFTEQFTILSLTGGVPWYLELINPAYPAQENIKDLCFSRSGVLVKEFENIFNDLFGLRAKIYKQIVKALSKASLTYQELVAVIDYHSGGPLSQYLDDLVLAGFISLDYSWSIKTAEFSKHAKYRIKDNYLRFYLRYIGPNLRKIEAETFQIQSLTALPSWNSIVGLQFENLVLNNRLLIIKELGIRLEDIVIDNPYFQKPTKLIKGCQIDYLIQTRQKTLYACEIKFSQQEVNATIINEMKQKLERLSVARGFSVCPVLIHINGVTDQVIDEDYFLRVIDFSRVS